MATRKSGRSRGKRSEPIANRGVYGEGNYQASREYNDATREFVRSGRVDRGRPPGGTGVEPRRGESRAGRAGRETPRQRRGSAARVAPRPTLEAQPLAGAGRVIPSPAGNGYRIAGPRPAGRSRRRRARRLHTLRCFHPRGRDASVVVESTQRPALRAVRVGFPNPERSFEWRTSSPSRTRETPTTVGSRASNRGDDRPPGNPRQPQQPGRPDPGGTPGTKPDPYKHPGDEPDVQSDVIAGQSRPSHGASANRSSGGHKQRYGDTAGKRHGGQEDR